MATQVRAPRAPMPEDLLVVCPRCKLEHRDITEQQWQNRAYLCRQCRAEKAKARYWKDPEKHLARQRAASHRVMLNYRYGLSEQDWQDMVEMQESSCAICGKPEDDPKKLHVDHNHDTGQVRQLLCNNCNVGLGYFNDDPERMMQAAKYLERHLTPRQ